MTIKINRLAIVAIMLIGMTGCGTSSQSVMTEEEFERVKNGETVIINNRQSHGLLGDLIDSTYKISLMS